MKKNHFISSLIIAAAVSLIIIFGCSQGIFVDPFLYGIPNKGPAPLTVVFRISQADYFETIEWLPGDGTAIIGNDSDTFTHTYQDPGTYYASCFLYDYQNSDLNRGTYTIITVTEPGFSASISTELEEICFASVSIPVSFHREVTEGKPPYTYAWDFGDGGESSSSDNPITHSYNPSEPGMTYLVELTVTDSTYATVTSNELYISFIDCASGP
jgi:PKD repeat protein